VAKFVTIQGCYAVFPTTETKTYDATDKKHVFVKHFTEKIAFFPLFRYTECRIKQKLQSLRTVATKQTLCSVKTLCTTRCYWDNQQDRN